MLAISEPNIYEFYNKYFGYLYKHSQLVNADDLTDKIEEMLKFLN